MCGFSGLLDPGQQRSGTSNAAIAASMARRVSHRGPDDNHLWQDAAAGVALAFRRLSVVDRSPAGRQPMTSADGRFVVMLNGEVYNATDLRADIEAVQGPTPWRGGSDTEVLIEAIALWGVEAAIGAANGMFALVAWDRAERTLWLARDRMGKKPLHYGWAGQQFVFASELKSLLAHPDLSRAIDAEAAAQCLQLGYVVGHRSILASVAKLPAGHILRMRPADAAARHSPDTRPYWSQREVALRGLEAQLTGDAATPEELDALLDDAVRRRAVADVPVGALLSGGVDSSLVASRLVRCHPRVRTFCIGFLGAPWNEAPSAQAVADHLGTRHETLNVGPGDVLATVARIPAVFDEPFADHSAIPMLLLSHFARREVTVALSGDGGDELFAGYDRYRALARWLGRRDAIPQTLRPLLSRLAVDVAAPAVHRLGSRRLVRRLGLLGSLLAEGGPARFAERMALQIEDPRALLPLSAAPAAPLRPAASALPLGTPLDEAMLLDGQTSLIDGILTKVDRASMDASLEVRCPLLDYRVVELAWRMPASEKLRGGVGKRPLRDLLHQNVPRALVDRPKMGFGAPIELWLRHGLRDWAESVMSPTSLARSGLIDVRAARRVWDDFVRGRSYQPLLWHIIMFQAWHDAMAGTTASGPELLQVA